MEKKTLHFQNDLGVAAIQVNAGAFMCMGASPPHDHPHVFLTFGQQKEIRCPYCSTLYVYCKELEKGQSIPAEAKYS